jgi:PAS domain S-box-containing protein
VQPKAEAYVCAVIGLGALALAYGLYGWAPRNLLQFAGYLALAIPASCLKVTLPGVTGTMSVLFVFLLAGIVDLDLAATLTMGALCVIAQCFWHAKARPRLIQVLFNVAVMVLALTVTYSIYRAFPWVASPVRLAVGASAYFFLNTFPIAVVISLTEDKPLGDIWKSCYLWYLPYYLVGAALVGALSFGNRGFDWKAAILVVPVVYVIYRSYQLYLRQLGSERARADEERKRAQEERRHSEEIAGLQARTMEALESSISANARLDAVYKASRLAIVALDRKGYVTSWNPMAEQMFGWSPEEVLGQFLPLASSRGEEAIHALTARTLRGEAIPGMEMKQWRKDGTPFDAALWTAVLREGVRDDKGIAGILVTIADVSDRKRLEEQLRLSQKLEAVGRLAGGIAHDFNNLLTVINGYSSMLAETASAEPDTANQVDEILAAGTRAADLVSQLLTFSRRQMIKPTALDVNQFVRDVQRMLDRVIGEHIELRKNLRDDAGWIHADLNQMEGVLLNLATNARDAMPEGGVLTIETGRADVPERGGEHPELAAGSYVRLMIRDTGQGMDAETRQRLFEPFYTTKAQGKGMGLGLASVYGGVEQNNGRIFVSSEVRLGSTFEIYLPRIDAPETTAASAPAARETSRGTETILLVEDEAVVRRMLRAALTGAGYRVWEAANGVEAIGKWSGSLDKIDLVVTDIVMPLMNGLKLTEELRARRADLKVVCMSGHSEDILNRQKELDPAPDLLRKPFLPEALVRKVREVLEQPAGRPGEFRAPLTS